MPPTFTVYSTPSITTFFIQCDSYYPFSHWMPWIGWKGEWKESYPMETMFRIKNIHLEATIQALLQRGFVVGPVSYHSLSSSLILLLILIVMMY